MWFVISEFLVAESCVKRVLLQVAYRGVLISIISCNLLSGHFCRIESIIISCVRCRYVFTRLGSAPMTDKTRQKYLQEASLPNATEHTLLVAAIIRSASEEGKNFHQVPGGTLDFISCILDLWRCS